MSQGFERYEKEIMKPRVMYWLFISLAVISPLVFLLIRFVGAPNCTLSGFHRSGSVMISFAAIAEVFAVSIFNKLNPSGFVGAGFEEFHKRYSRLPVRYTFIALLIAIIGTLISGFGDLVFES